MNAKTRTAAWSLSRRLILSSALWMIVAFVVGGVLLSNMFEDYARRKFDERLVAPLESLIGSSEILNGALVQLTRSLGDQRFEQAYSGWYWQISIADKEPLRSRSLWDQLLSIDHSNPVHDMRFSSMDGPGMEDLRVVEMDVFFPDMNVPVRFIVAGDAAEMLADVETSDALLFYALGALGLIMLVTMGAQLWLTLYPLKNIRKELSAVRTGKAQYLDYNYPQEVQPLASEVNALLSHNQNMVTRARRQVGNLAHALKTPLSVLLNDAQSRGDEGALRQLENMQRHVDHNLARARVIGRPRLAGAKTNVKERLEAMARTLMRLHGDKVNFVIHCDEGVYFAGEQEDFDEIIGNVMDNAAKWANSVVDVYVEPSTDVFFDLSIEDDGPGVSEDDLERMFGHGVRLDETVPGTGLGLAIVSDIVDMVGGHIYAENSERGGLCVDMDLPLAEGD